MKHWDSLTKLESSIIDLNVPKHIMSLMAMSAEDISRETNIHMIYHVEKLLETSLEELQENFQNLFDEVRDGG